MDNNKPQAPTPQAAAQPQTPQPVSSPMNIPGGSPSTSGGNKSIVWILMGVVLVILLGSGGYYLYMQNQKNSNQAQTEQTDTTIQPVVEEDLEDQLEDIDVEATDSSFTSVDQDIQGLR